MTVDAVEFPLNAKKFSGATLMNTSIMKGLNGAEVRNSNWQDSLRRFNVALGIKSLTDIQTLDAFFLACKGPAIGFLIKDWKDFKATQGANGVTTATFTTTTGTTFQLGKTYSNGVRTHTRKITRPKSSAVTLYPHGGGSAYTEGVDFTLNYTTGIVTMASALNGSSQWPRWTGEFFVPVRFESDELPSDLMQYKINLDSGYGDMPAVICLEIREC